MKYKVEDFVSNLTLSPELHKIGIYNVNQLISIQKRFNNAKRDFLFVNKMQGKHIATRPRDFMTLCHAMTSEFLANSKVYKESKILVLGFAETATALGAEVAFNLKGRGFTDIYYAQTTRDNVMHSVSSDEMALLSEEEKKNIVIQNGQAFIYIGPVILFSEEHSHATEQKFYCWNDTDLPEFDHVIFVDDEITTGKTVRNLKKVMQEGLNCITESTNFSILTVLSFVTGENNALLLEDNITSYALVKGILREERPIIEDLGITYSSRNFKKLPDHFYSIKSMHTCKEDDVLLAKYNVSEIDNLMNLTVDTIKSGDTRDVSEYHKVIDALESELKDIEGAKVLVIGTEEFMYKPLLLASGLEARGFNVYYKATTRSPIKCNGVGNIIKGYEFTSLHTDSVVNYIYTNKDEFVKYDKVIICDTLKETNLKYTDTVFRYANLISDDVSYVAFTK